MQRIVETNGHNETTEKGLKTSANSTSDGEQDRLSSLPDSILIHILSFLPIVDAIRTVLIRRFGYLWTSIPCLRFQYGSVCTYICSKRYGDEFADVFPAGSQTQGIDFIHHVLALHKCPHIDEFLLEVDFEHESESDLELLENEEDDKLAKNIGTWILFAVTRKVKVLDLKFHHRYELPNFVLRCMSLEKLYLFGCSFPTPYCNKSLSGFNKRSLKELKLSHIDLIGKTIDEILSGCPSLELLSITESYCPDKLILKLLSLKSLTLRDNLAIQELEIYCPSVISLDVGGYLEHVVAGSFPDIVYAYLDVKCVYMGTLPQYDYVRELLQQLKNARAFSVGLNLNLVLSAWELRNVPCPLLSWKSLTFMADLTAPKLPGFAWMMRNCSDLENLDVAVLHGPSCSLDGRFLGCHYLEDLFLWDSQQSFSEDILDSQHSIRVKDFWDSQDTFSCLSNSLKTVQIRGWVTDPLVFHLLKFLLQNSMMLERLVFYSNNDEESSDLETLLQNLLRLPRASSKAVIHFKFRDVLNRTHETHYQCIHMS